MGGGRRYLSKAALGCVLPYLDRTRRIDDRDAKPGAMYCDYCTDDGGQLRPFEDILEGTITGYFMGMQKMERGPAEAAAKEHLAKMPAWANCQ